MVVKITYFVHGTTTDNEDHKATGWAPGKLSELGIQQSIDLSKIVKDEFDALFTSDLKRAIDSAKLAWNDKYDIIEEMRLRECNYGDWNEKKKDWSIFDFISNKYPNGESYKDVEVRIKNFLNFLKNNYDGKHIAIVAHQAPQLAIQVLLEKKSWEIVISEDWRKTKAWQPGWDYIITEKSNI